MAEWFSIRSATTDDQSFISEMQYEAFFVVPGDDPFPLAILDEPQILKYHAGFGASDGDVGVIAESPDGQPLGVAWVRVVDGYGFVDAATPELGIAVVQAARGAGVGSALLTRLFAEVPRCSLSVDDRNPGVRLYERLGFAKVRTDGHSVVMLRDGTRS